MIQPKLREQFEVFQPKSWDKKMPRKRVCPVNYVDDETEETYYMGDDEMMDEAAPIEEGDESAFDSPGV